MADPPAAPKPCCVCCEPGGKHCTKCKSRHYCGRVCQLVDWYEHGHKAQCKRLAAEFQDRLLDSLSPETLDLKETEEPKAAPRLPAARATAEAEAGAPNADVPDWRGTCAICLDLLPVEEKRRAFYECCCKFTCAACQSKCQEYDNRCPLCRAAASKSDDDVLRRLQKHADAGNAEAQVELGYANRDATNGLKQNFRRARQWFERAAAQGYVRGQAVLGSCYYLGQGVEVNYETAAMWVQRAAEQGYPQAQSNLGLLFYDGDGVAQSYEEAARWFRLAAAQGDAEALFKLGSYYIDGRVVLPDFDEALRLFRRAAAKGDACALKAIEVVARHAA